MDLCPDFSHIRNVMILFSLFFWWNSCEFGTAVSILNSWFLQPTPDHDDSNTKHALWLWSISTAWKQIVKQSSGWPSLQSFSQWTYFDMSCAQKKTSFGSRFCVSSWEVSKMIENKCKQIGMIERPKLIKQKKTSIHHLFLSRFLLPANWWEKPLWKHCLTAAKRAWTSPMKIYQLKNELEG